METLYAGGITFAEIRIECMYDGISLAENLMLTIWAPMEGYLFV